MCVCPLIFLYGWYFQVPARKIPGRPFLSCLAGLSHLPPSSWSAFCSHDVSSSFSQDTNLFRPPIKGRSSHWGPPITLEPFVFLSYATTVLWPPLSGCRALAGKMMNLCSLQRTDRQQLFHYSYPVWLPNPFPSMTITMVFHSFQVSVQSPHSVSKDDIISFFNWKDLGQGSQTKLPTGAIKITEMKEEMRRWQPCLRRGRQQLSCGSLARCCPSSLFSRKIKCLVF